MMYALDSNKKLDYTLKVKVSLWAYKEIINTDSGIVLHLPQIDLNCTFY